MPEDETDAFPVVETPPSYEVARPRYFGLTPRGLVAALAVVAFALAIVGFATSGVAVGVLLLVASGFLAALCVEQARRRRESSFDRVTAAAVDHTRALAGFTGSSLRAWTRAGREVAKLRVEASMRARERSQLQYALGGACFEDDDARIADLRERMRLCTDRIDACAGEARAVLAQTRRRTARDRLAIAQTRVRKP